MIHRTKIILEWTIFSLLGLILILSTFTLFYQKAYAGKIYPNIFISEINLSGKTKTQAKFILDNKLSNTLNKEIVLVANQKEITTQVVETGLGIDIDQTINQAYAVGRSSSFIPQLWRSVATLFKDNQIDLTITLDQKKFDQFISQKIPELQIEPKDASLTIESGQIIEHKEENGQTVDTSNLENEIRLIAKEDNTSGSINIDISTTAIEPQIKIADLNSAKEYSKNILSKSIAFTYQGNSYTPTKSNIGNWIAFSTTNGKYSAGLSDSAIKTYLTKVARNFEIQKIDKKINAANGEVIEEGRTGVYLDKNKALSDIKFQISSKNSFQVTMQIYEEAPGEIKIFPSEGVVPGRFEGKYIDIDLSHQKLCIIDTNNILGCYTVSTGKPSMPTPTGTRFVQNKTPRAWSAKYELYMPWWMSIGGGYGIHELPEWPGGYKEGADHLGIPVSHGCVRLGVGPAQTVYNFISIGNPVYIHK